MANSSLVAAQPVDQSTWSPSSELVVKAPWPPMWRLTRGDSTVWVLVSLRRVPENMVWDSTRVKRLLKGSKLLIVPEGSPGTWPLQTDLTQKTLKDVVSPEIYGRFQTTVVREGLNPALYEKYKPAWAGHFLSIDVHHQRNFKGQYYPPYITDLAQRENVRIKRVDISVKSNYFDHLNALDMAGSEACLVTYLDGIDFNVTNVPKMAEAWANSDVPALLGYYAAYPKDNCSVPNDPLVAERKSMTVNRLVGAIEDALSSPGHSVAIVPLDWLLVKDGVLDRLGDKGVEIRAPAE